MCGLYIFNMPSQRIPKVTWLDKALSHVGPMTSKTVKSLIGSLTSRRSSLSLYVKARSSCLESGLDSTGEHVKKYVDTQGPEDLATAFHFSIGGLFTSHRP